MMMRLVFYPTTGFELSWSLRLQTPPRSPDRLCICFECWCSSFCRRRSFELAVQSKPFHFLFNYIFNFQYLFASSQVRDVATAGASSCNDCSNCFGYGKASGLRVVVESPTPDATPVSRPIVCLLRMLVFVLLSQTLC